MKINLRRSIACVIAMALIAFGLCFFFYYFFSARQIFLRYSDGVLSEETEFRVGDDGSDKKLRPLAKIQSDQDSGSWFIDLPSNVDPIFITVRSKKIERSCVVAVAPTRGSCTSEVFLTSTTLTCYPCERED